MDFLTEHCVFVPVTSEMKSSLARFGCAKEDKIEKFFRSEALEYADELMGQSYAFVDKDSQDIVGAFCVACASVSTSEMPKPIRNKLNRNVPYVKQRDTYPAVLLAQFAVDDKYANLHLGTKILSLIKVWIVKHASQISGRYLIVDAVNTPKVIDFYTRNGFRLVFATEDDERLHCEMTPEEMLETRFMIYDLKEVKSSSL